MSARDGQKLWFWRRFTASAVDLLLGAFLFTLAIVAIFGGLSDKVRLNGLGFSTQHCGPVNPSEDLAARARVLAPNLVWTKVGLCTVRTFGLAENRLYVFERAEVRNGATMRAGVWFIVDANGRPVSPYFADWIGFVLIIAAGIAFLASPLKATPGLYVTGLEMRKYDGARASFLRLIARQLSIVIPIALIALVTHWIVWLLLGGATSPVLRIVPFLFAPLVFGLWWRPFMLLSTLPRAPTHDILTGVRVGRRNPSISPDLASPLPATIHPAALS